MACTPSSARLLVRAAVLALALGGPAAQAEGTSLQLYGVLFDGSGNRINGTGILSATAIYGSASGGTLLADLGTEAVNVGNGSFLQVFSVDDSLFAGDAWLQVTINGFTLQPRLGITYNLSYYVANGVASGPAGNPIFQLYAGTSAPPPVPEPATGVLLGLGVAALALRRASAAR